MNDYAFDSSGNTTKDANGRTFIYDAENKQVEVKNASNETIGKYWYDGDGRRVKKLGWINGQWEETIFVYDASSRLVAEYSTVMNPTPQVAYLTNDHLGSPRIKTNELGAVISRHDYRPYGEEVAERTHAQYVGDTIRKQFTGYERDEETDLDFAQSRYLNNKYGRFVSADEPFADQSELLPQSWNMYAFVRNNPLNMTDPFGTSAGCPPGSPPGCVERDGLYFTIDDDGVEREWEPGIIEVEERDVSCEKRFCKVELDDSPQDWIPAYGSLRRMVWNMRCTTSGGCDFTEATYYFGLTAFELTPLGWASRAAKAAQAAPRILPKLCFVAGTLVLTEDGLKPIEEIKAGDKVLSYNEKTKQTEYRTVLQTMVREAEAGRLLSLKVEGESKPLGVTGEHPFYVRVHGARSDLSGDDDDGKWIEAKHLQAGDEIRKADGTWARVESVNQRSKGAKVYNFEVADNHNYFVGQSHLLVHNNCIVKLTEAGKRKIGNLGNYAQTKAREVLAARGGNASATRVGDVPAEYWDKALAEIANLAANKDMAAETVMKLIKQASAKAQKY